MVALLSPWWALGTWFPKPFLGATKPSLPSTNKWQHPLILQGTLLTLALLGSLQCGFPLQVTIDSTVDSRCSPQISARAAHRSQASDKLCPQVIHPCLSSPCQCRRSPACPRYSAVAKAVTHGGAAYSRSGLCQLMNMFIAPRF